MKFNLLKRALPFLLSLIVGITLTQLIVGRKFHRKHRHRAHRALEVKSVPFVDFPATDLNGLRATITLRALFDADGKVKETSSPELEEFRRKKALADLAHPEWTQQQNEPAKKASESTERLVDRLLDSAVYQLQQVIFRPGRARGAAVSQWVNAQVTFQGAAPISACDSIRVRITDDRGNQLWEGETLKDRSPSCSQ